LQKGSNSNIGPIDISLLINSKKILRESKKMSKKSSKSRSKQKKASFYLKIDQLTKKTRLNKSKNLMFLILRIIKTLLLLKLKRKFL
jgi:hypothetical protein